MTAIKAVSADTPVRAEHINQYRRTLSSVLGVHDTAQTDLGRLVVPNGSSFPSNGAGMTQGRIFQNNSLNGIYVNTSTTTTANWRDLGAVRQVVREPAKRAIRFTPLAWNHVLSLEITTTGGRVFVFGRLSWEIMTHITWLDYLGQPAHVGMDLRGYYKSDDPDTVDMWRYGFNVESTWTPPNDETIWVGHNMIQAWATPEANRTFVFELWAYMWTPFTTPSFRGGNRNIEDDIWGPNYAVLEGTQITAVETRR